MSDILVTGKNELEVILFQIHNKSYAINVSKVREILNFIPYTKIPLTPPALLGMIKSREEVIPIISLQKYLNEPKTDETKGKFIVTDFFNMRIGFLVDSVKKLIRIGWDNIQPSSEIGINPITIGTIKYEKEIIYMIDFEKIVVELNPIIAFKGDNSLITEYKEKQVCIAEDSKTTRNLIKKHLKDKGFKNVMSFSDGQKALNYFIEVSKQKDEKGEIKELPDILITDIEMPLMDGYTLIKKTRELELFKDLPIIIFSSISTPEVHFKKDVVGANAHITKYDLDNLDNLIKLLLLGKES